VPLIVNDDPRLAAEVEADGVHLGRDDRGLRPARKLLGPSAIIGVSCYDRLERARVAQAEGADYLAFGRFFPSHSKPGAVPAGIELLRAAHREFYLPLVAIGGITPENGRA
jgi:thiamine-phosphate pyrophosphorylase